MFGNGFDLPTILICIGILLIFVVVVVLISSKKKNKKEEKVEIQTNNVEQESENTNNFVDESIFKEEVKEVRDSLTCPSCVAENPKEAKFCHNCGHKFE